MALRTKETSHSKKETSESPSSNTPIIFLRPKGNIGESEPTLDGLILEMKTQKKIHAIATLVFRNNYISFIKSCDNIMVHEHEQKAAILWQYFKHRIGKTKDIV